MKKNILFFAILTTSLSFGQNTFPTTGNVGIGTREPNQKLTIHEGNLSLSSYGSWVGIASPSSGVRSYARILGTDTANSVDRACLTTNGYVSTANGALLQDNISLPTWALTLDANNDAFYIKRAPAGSLVAGALSSFVTVNNLGNVGIGTTNPLQKLDVNGGIRFNTGIAGGLYAGEDTSHPRKVFGVDAPGKQYAYIQSPDNDPNDGIQFKDSNGSALVTILEGGNVGIGINAPDTKLAVNGTIHAKEVKIDLLSPMTVPDYVFANDYKLKTLPEVEKYIKENSHLPEISSAKEFEKNGILLAEMNMKLLKKVEELTLYAIEQEKKTKKLTIELIEQNKIVMEQNKRIEKLEKQ